MSYLDYGSVWPRGPVDNGRPLAPIRYPKRSYLTYHTQIDHPARICSPDKLADRPRNTPPFVFFGSLKLVLLPHPNRNDGEASRGVSHAPQGELILVIFLRGSGPRRGQTRGTTGHHFLSFQSHFVCLVPISLCQFSYDVKPVSKPFCGCNTAYSVVGSIVQDISSSV
jgi:hypothetical protein